MTPEEIRARLLAVVPRNGGHLASSLGAVEIAVALAEVFEPEKDRIVWDVGHQSYAWKILTGRDGRFDSLRQLDGLSGFPHPSESLADAAVAGHAGVALSVAEGLAAAREISGRDEHVVAVVGDASLVNGTSLEAINNCASSCRKLIVVLNDNEMSISRPTGSIAKMLGRLITNVRYNRVKTAAEAAGHRLRLTFLRDAYHRLESRVKGLFLGNAVFERFGIRYIGPVDGHDLKALKAAFTVAKEDKRSVLVHVVTHKGHGYAPAEAEPTKWHGIAGANETRPSGKGWSAAFGEILSEAARRDNRIVALTAGMKDGTGLADFAREFPTRFRDVGIAEGHMAAYAGGLAAGGLRPVVAVYSTFLQRAVDQVFHDVCLANLPVVFCVDRAGIVGRDGVTHQGLYDLAMLRALPNLTICQPKDEADFRALFDEALRRNGPTVIRYPRGVIPPPPPQPSPSTSPFAIWATGDWYGRACAVAARLGGTAVHARYLKPFDADLLARQRAAGLKVVSLENASVTGGLGEAIGADIRFGWPDEPIPHGAPEELERRYGLDADGIVRTLAKSLRKEI